VIRTNTSDVGFGGEALEKRRGLFRWGSFRVTSWVVPVGKLRVTSWVVPVGKLSMECDVFSNLQFL
jgi:hypothetical protein